MTSIPKNGFILAAEPKNDETTHDSLPRPIALVEVDGRTLIDRTLDHYCNVGVERVVINCHGKSSALKKKLKNREQPSIIISDEDTLLGTGGALGKCIDILGDDTFYIANADTLWFDGANVALERLASAWDNEKMDALLLLYPVTAVKSYQGQGEYFVDQVGRTKRRTESVSPYVYSGIAILHSRLFYEMPKPPFSLDTLLKTAEDQERLYSVIHGGSWFHMNSKTSLDEAERFIKSKDLA